MMKPGRFTPIILLCTALAAPAYAQPGPGMGGMGPGKGARFSWNRDYTPGWRLMTDQERNEWRAKMRAVQTYDECKALQEEHQRTMEARAAEKGVKLVPPRHNGCDVMKGRGLIK